MRLDADQFLLIVSPHACPIISVLNDVHSISMCHIQHVQHVSVVKCGKCQITLLMYRESDRDRLRTEYVRELIGNFNFDIL